MENIKEPVMVSEVIYIAYVSYLLEGEKSKCAAIVGHLLEQNIEITTLYRDLFQRSLYRVGDLWEEGKLSVGEEHMAACITESLMNLAYPAFYQKGKNGKKAVVTCVPQEFHQIGARMVSDVFENNGWQSYYLGANTPQKELWKLMDIVKPDAIALSVGYYLNFVRLMEMTENLKKRYPGVRIITGGNAFRNEMSSEMKKIEGVRYIESICELDELLRSNSPL